MFMGLLTAEIMWKHGSGSSFFFLPLQVNLSPVRL